VDHGHPAPPHFGGKKENRTKRAGAKDHLCCISNHFFRMSAPTHRVAAAAAPSPKRTPSPTLLGIALNTLARHKRWRTRDRFQAFSAGAGRSDQVARHINKKAVTGFRSPLFLKHRFPQYFPQKFDLLLVTVCCNEFLLATSLPADSYDFHPLMSIGNAWTKVLYRWSNRWSLPMSIDRKRQQWPLDRSNL
jgi:hypothetical protein